MSKERCPYCHEYIDSDEFENHCKSHEKLKPDGQQEEYITLPPEMRTERSLKDVPQIYHHQKCGGITRMPEEIVRSYLVNPYLYLADKTFCTGCGEHVPNKECNWVKTGEDLQTHINRLRASKREFRPGLFSRLLILFLHKRWIK